MFLHMHRALDLERNVAVAIKCMQRPDFNAIGEHEAAFLRKIGARDPDAHCAGAAPCRVRALAP